MECAVVSMSNEPPIVSQDDSLIESTAEGAADGVERTINKKGVAWLDMFLGLIGRRQAKLSEPSDEAIKRTQEYLREKAKGAMFFESSEVDTVRPMLEVAWAPMLGAFSVLYEQHDDEDNVSLCLQGEEQQGTVLCAGSFKQVSCLIDQIWL